MATAPTVVIFPDIAWDGLHQRPQHLAIALAKHRKVLWAEPATLGGTTHRRVREAAPNIFVISLPVIPYNARNAVIRRLARWAGRSGLFRSVLVQFQERIVRGALASIGADRSALAVLLQNFHVFGLVRRLSARPVVYDYIDNAFGFTELPALVKEEWSHVVRTADRVAVTSPGLADQVRGAGGRDPLYVGNGVEYARFAAPDPGPRPADLPAGEPIVCYVGAVYPWLDFDLLENVFREMRGVRLVFIGPVHPDVRPSMDRLAGLGNVTSLGFRPYAELPRYLRHVDVGIIPFRKSDLTRTVNPVKLYEYCAAGVPTVATAFSADILQFRDVIAIADTPEECRAAIAGAIAAPGKAERAASLQAFARRFDWEAVTKELVDLFLTNAPH
jgi:glycosyltransferase involved in cell wall biosynthesis